MKIPPIIYGTAWKKDRTADLVFKALRAGFRGIDTAAQPKHYYEKGVGEALGKIEALGLNRQSLFIQTKFTPLSGQDPMGVPYDPNEPLTAQVVQSFTSSQKNLGTPYVDSLVLHSPLPHRDSMIEVWKAMESIHQGGGARMLGISNCYELETLQDLYHNAEIKPSVVQNRFYGKTSYDSELRLWCNHKNITYQSFWTLTANPHIIMSPLLQQIAQSHDRTGAQIFFRFIIQLGIVPLSGTTSEVHMKEDLEVFDFELSKQEQDRIQSLLKAV
jgi:diketogulonate reductase-like aldo/keto reductase